MTTEKTENLPAVVEHDTFDLSEIEDESQILAELQGRSAEKLIYSFNSGSGPVEGLSYAGTRWAAREYSKHGEVIRIVGKPEFMVDPTNPEFIFVTTQAQRFAVDKETGREIALDNTFGIKRKWTKMKLRDQRVVPDPFYAEKALSMSQRNSLKALLPTSFVVEVIKKIKSGEHIPKGAMGGQRGAAARQAAASTPKPPAGIEEQTQEGFEVPPPPAETVPASKPAAPKQAAKAAAASPAKQPAQETQSAAAMTIRNRLFMNMKKLLGTEEVCRAALKLLTGKDKTRDLEDKVIEQLNAEIIKCFPGGPNEVLEGGKFLIEKATKKVVFPKGAKLPEAAPVEPPQTQEEAPPTPEEPMF